MNVEGEQIQVAVVGESCTGKTCFVKRFVDNTFFSTQYNPTAGVDFFSRRMNAKPYGTVTLIISDLSGTTVNSKMLPIYLHAIDVFFLVYDTTNTTSLEFLRKWIKIIASVNEQSQPAPTLVLIGTKADLEHLRTVRLDLHTKFAQEFCTPLSFLVSSKTGDSVHMCFAKTAMHHLSPDAKKNPHHQHVLLESTVPKRQSVSVPVQMTKETTVKEGSNGKTDPSSQDPHSTVCIVA